MGLCSCHDSLQLEHLSWQRTEKQPRSFHMQRFLLSAPERPQVRSTRRHFPKKLLKSTPPQQNNTLCQCFIRQTR